MTPATVRVKMAGFDLLTRDSEDERERIIRIRASHRTTTPTRQQLEIPMAPHHARSVLAALTVAAALTTTACTADSGTGARGDSPTSIRPSHATHSDSATPGRTSSDSGEGSQSPTTPGSSGATTSPAGGSSTTAPGGVPWCTTDSLSADLHPGHPGAGNRYATLSLTNESKSTCVTRGWPGLQLTAADGGRLPTKAVRDRSRAALQVTLSPGERASSRLHWTTVPGRGDPADGGCPTPRALRVIPPDQRAAGSAGWSLGTVCGAGRIDVLALTTSGAG